MFAVLAIGLALLSVGGATSSATPLSAVDPPSAHIAPTAVPTPTSQPTPTATPVPLPPPPLVVPPGWQVYRGHHFAVAYPAAWVVSEHDVQDANGEVVAAALTFNSPDGSQSVAVDEHDGLDAATMQRYCAQPGSKLTYAGLPMRTALTSGTLRTFVFVASPTDTSTGGTAYTLLYSEEDLSQQVKWFYDSIFATFRPEYSSPGCR